MKKNFRIIPFLVLLLALTLSVSVYAKTDEEVIKDVSDANIMTGTDNGFEGEKTLTRAEAATIVVRMKAMEDEAVSEINYVDVARDYWAYKYISIATKEGITKGTGADTFTPQRTVTVGETVTMLVRAITDETEIAKLEKKSWPNNYMNFARDKKLLVGLSNVNASNEISRIDTARIISNIRDALNMNEDDKEKKEEISENGEPIVKSVAGNGIILSIAQLAGDQNEIELAIPGRVLILNADNSELSQGVCLEGTYVSFWLAGTRMWDIVAEQKVTNIKENERLAKIINFDDGVVKLIKKPEDPEHVLTVNDVEYVSADSLVYLACDEMKASEIGLNELSEMEYLREFDDLRVGSEFEIETTDDYNGLKYSEVDGTEVFYHVRKDKKTDEDVIVSMIYVKD